MDFSDENMEIQVENYDKLVDEQYQLLINNRMQKKIEYDAIQKYYLNIFSKKIGKILDRTHFYENINIDNLRGHQFKSDFFRLIKTEKINGKIANKKIDIDSKTINLLMNKYPKLNIRSGNIHGYKLNNDFVSLSLLPLI